MRKNKIRCPKCNSTQVTYFIEDDKKGFKCSKCDYKWSQRKLIKK